MPATKTGMFTLDAAGLLWGARIDSDAQLDVVVRADRGALRAGGTYSQGRLLFTDEDGVAVWEPGPLTEVLTGSNPGFRDQGFDILLTFDPIFVTDNYPFSEDPETGLSWTPPGAQTGFIWVVLHELGHALGFGGERMRAAPESPDYGYFPLNFKSLFDSMSDFDGGSRTDAQGNTVPLIFQGAKSSVRYGDAVPLTNLSTNDPNRTANFYHLGDCQSRVALRHSLMNGCASRSGNESITEMDLDALRDMGYPMRALHPTFDSSTLELHLPFVVLNDKVVYDVSLKLGYSNGTNEFVVKRVSAVPLGVEHPVPFNTDSSQLVLPEVLAQKNGREVIYAATLAWVRGSAPPRFTLESLSVVD